jgi:uncharacterized glyoxalase superfamily protein PhnB
MPTSATTVGSIFPAIRFEDARTMIQWLGEAFGFEPMAVYDAPDGSVAHAELRLERGAIMLGQSREDDLGTRSPRAVGGVTQTIYACVQDVDAHYRRAVGAGAEIVRPLADTPYGSREYSARDPEGHVWSFGSYMPGA